MRYRRLNGITSWLPISLAMLAMPLIGALPAWAITLQPQVVVYNGPPPGVPGGVSYAGINIARLLDTGTPYFSANLTGTGVTSTSDHITVQGFAAAPSLILRTGVLTPVLSGNATFNEQYHWTLDSTGMMAFVGDDASQTAATQQSVWSGLRGSFRVVARRGASAVGAGTGVNFNIFQLGSNSGSFLAFNASLTGTGVGPTNDRGIWSGTAAGIEMIARNGGAAPGRVAPFGLLDVPSVHPGNRVTFGERTTNYGSFPNYFNSYWVKAPANPLQKIITSGDPIPGEADTFTNFLNLELNSAGSFAFGGRGNGEPAQDPTGIWSNRTGTLQKVVRRLDPAPGTGTSSLFNTFGVKRINSTGDILYYGSLTQPTSPGGATDGWWVNRGGLNERVILQNFDHGDGQVLRNVAADMNELGSIVYSAEIVPQPLHSGIWTMALGGEPQLLIRDGDQIDIGGGVLRTVVSLNSQWVLNNNNQLLFTANFGGQGSGVFMVTVPEPSSAVFGLLGALVLSRRLRRNQ